MAITLEQKLDCLTDDEYNAIEELVDLILTNRRDKKSFSDGGNANAKGGNADVTLPAKEPARDYRCEECKELEGGA